MHQLPYTTTPTDSPISVLATTNKTTHYCSLLGPALLLWFIAGSLGPSRLKTDFPNRISCCNKHTQAASQLQCCIWTTAHVEVRWRNRIRVRSFFHYQIMQQHKLFQQVHYGKDYKSDAANIWKILPVSCTFWSPFKKVNLRRATKAQKVKRTIPLLFL